MVAFNLSKILVVLASALSVSVSADANVDGNTAGPKAYEGTRSRIVKRGEGIHLVNCGSAYSAVVVCQVNQPSLTVPMSAETKRKLMRDDKKYCPNDGDCNRNPGSGNSCVPPPGGIARWEGATRNCRFSTGVTFTWNVRADAQNNSVRNYTSVGCVSSLLFFFFSFFLCRDPRDDTMEMATRWWW